MKSRKRPPGKPGRDSEQNASLPLSGCVGDGVGDAFRHFLLKSGDVGNAFLDHDLPATLSKETVDREKKHERMSLRGDRAF